MVSVMEREVRFYGLSYEERSLVLWTMPRREKSGFMDSVMKREVWFYGLSYEERSLVLWTQL